MEHLTRGVREALANNNWYAAIALALTIPDACAAIDAPRGRRRYEVWVDRYVTRHFCDPNGRPYLTARELYLFRCAYLHAGELVLDDPEPADPDDSRAMFEVLNRMNFFVADVRVLAARGMTSSPGGSPPARATSYNVDVRDFCEAICAGAEEWLAQADPATQQRIAAVPRVIFIGPDGAQTRV